MWKHGLTSAALASCLALPAIALAQAADAAPASAGIPPGVAALKGQNSKGFLSPATMPGRPVETRPPELAGDRPAFPGQTRAPYRATPAFRTTTITDKLKSPWSLAFLPDGKMLVTEKPGTLRIVEANGAISPPLAGVPRVSYQGQAGLLDVALDRRFPSNHRLFLSFTESAGGADSHVAVARAELDEAGRTLRNVKVIFRARPDLSKARTANQGGRIVVDPKGDLFVAIGDRSTSPPWRMAQKLDNDLGKIVHITAEGAPAAGNPFAGQRGARPEIWSLGHRTEEGLAYDPAGRLWETEHGPRGGDELNLIAPGKNYGWPVIVHGIDYPGEKIDGGLTQKAGLEQPRYYWDPVIAPSGLAFYAGGLFPQWRSSVFVGGLRGMRLDRLTLSGDKVLDEEPLLTGLKNRVRDVRIGPDGAVYVLTDEGRLLKLTPR